jgi:hypothetical protein
VGEVVEEDKRTFPVMERMAFEQHGDGVTIIIAGHVDLISNTTV